MKTFIMRAVLFALLLVPLPVFAQENGAEANIVVTRPTANALITSPLIIEGEARVFENSLNYRLKDSAGDVLVQGFTTADAPDIGQFGDFRVYAPFVSPNGGTGTVEVFSFSPADGSEINKVTIPVRFATSAETASQVPLYRLWNGRIGDHFYTTSAAEREAAVRRFGYTFEGTTGFIYSSTGTGLTPLYRLWNPTITDHFYTTSAAERDAAVSKFGYRSEGVAGYINLATASETTALYRLWNARIADHFYTAKAAERDAAVARSGYRSEGTSGFIVRPEPTTLVKVYFNNSFLNPSTSDCDAVFPVVREVPQTLAVGTAALNELLEGPSTTETAEGYVSSLPNGVTLNSLTITNGVARADFSSALNNVAGSCRVIMIREQIERTLLQFPTVTSVIISVNGNTNVLQP